VLRFFGGPLLGTRVCILHGHGLTWDRPTLDRWLANPSQLVSGTKMYFKIDDAQSRADVIAYLEQLK
jgi:cytochrome c